MIHHILVILKNSNKLTFFPVFVLSTVKHVMICAAAKVNHTLTSTTDKSTEIANQRIIV